jgi:hypothetical protein
MIHKKIRYIIPFFLIISCSGSDISYTPCEERCEYRRRDCVEDCGGYDRAGFSVKIGENESFSPFSCTKRCDEKAEACRNRCASE